MNTEIYFKRNISGKHVCVKPHFCIVKLGFAGVYLFFFILIQNIDCRYSLEQHVPTMYVLKKNSTDIKIFLVKFSMFTAEKKNLCNKWASFRNDTYHLNQKL